MLQTLTKIDEKTQCRDERANNAIMPAFYEAK